MNSPGWYAEVPPRPPPAPRAAWRGRGSCTARDAVTGLRCRLPAHGDDNHASERGRFTRVAAPGQTTFEKVELLVAAATSQQAAWMGTSGDERAKNVERARAKAKAKARALAVPEAADA